LDHTRNENRVTKWTRYFNNHEDKLKDFQNFWHPNKVDANHVVTEIKEFYKWLSERIHHAHATGNIIEWNRHTLTPTRNKIAEYMCKGLNIEYRIFDIEKD